MELNHAVHLQWKHKTQNLFFRKVASLSSSSSRSSILMTAWMESSNKNCRLLCFMRRRHHLILYAFVPFPSHSCHFIRKTSLSALSVVDSSSEALELLFVSLNAQHIELLTMVKNIWNESHSTTINLNFYYEISSLFHSIQWLVFVIDERRNDWEIYSHLSSIDWVFYVSASQQSTIQCCEMFIWILLGDIIACWCDAVIRKKWELEWKWKSYVDWLHEVCDVVKWQQNWKEEKNSFPSCLDYKSFKKSRRLFLQ